MAVQRNVIRMLAAGSRKDYRDALHPLIDHLRRYDSLRDDLCRRGGTMADVQRLTALLSEPVRLRGDIMAHQVSLTDQRSIRIALNDVGDFNLHFQVRQHEPSRLPVYYLSRVARDFWSEYSLIVDDLYIGPGYPMTDERFVNLMDRGHELFYLRLSQFRNGTEQLISQGSPASESEVDECLNEIGRHVLQSAWHEDQRLAVLTSTHFQLPGF
ncbi:MAG TPA: hypothetical protein VFV34_12385, partial [Blastocatellia bacterium]|nr:hypothetical protein [Blastocatellia bacterium]